MEMECVMVIDADLPTGLIANTAAVLALTLGKKIEGIIGPTVIDGSGHSHTGITTTPFRHFRHQFFNPLSEKEVVWAAKSAEKAWRAKSNKKANEAAIKKGYPGADTI